METIKKEAIELLKKETTKMKELRIKNGEFEFKGECADVGESYSEFVLDGLGGMRYSIHDYDAAGTLLGIWKKEFGKIQRVELQGDRPRPAEMFDAMDWLGEHRDIYHHPRVCDRLDEKDYDVAELMADFANWYYENK